MQKLMHLSMRLFGSPLLIERKKLDAILYALKDRLGLDVSAIPSPEAYGPGDKAAMRKDYFVTEDGLAVIHVFGPLVKRESGGFMSGGPTTYCELENDFMDAATDPLIKGILLLVDSPGGEVTGCFELSDMIYGQRGSKPIIASVDGDAFSAAFALASAADKVVLTKSGGVGSVGVWMMHVDQSSYNEKVGLKPTMIFAGAHKVDANPMEPLSPEAQKSLQSEVDDIYEMFAETVARNRNMPITAVKGSEAALYYGQKGVDVGFADKLGTTADAMTLLRQAVVGAPDEGDEMPDEDDMPGKGDMPMSMSKEKTKEVDVQEKKEAVVAAPPATKPAEELVSASYVSEIMQLCALAGKPADAKSFIEARTSVEKVREGLQAAKVAEDARTEISSRTLPDHGARVGGDGSVEDSILIQVCTQRAEDAKKRK